MTPLSGPDPLSGGENTMPVTAIDNDIDELKGKIETALDQDWGSDFTESDNVQPANGSARARMHDFSGGEPSPPAGYEAGRLAFNTDGDYKGQLYIHDGSDWLALNSNRSIRLQADDVNVIASASGDWQDWDAADLTGVFEMTDDARWTYKILFHGSFELSAVYIFFVRIYNVTDAEVIATAAFVSTAPDGTLAVPILHCAISGFYQPSTAGEKTIKVQVKCTAGVSIERVSDGLTLLPNFLSIEEAPA